jgi:arylsulfatase A-like enzyme
MRGRALKRRGIVALALWTIALCASGTGCSQQEQEQEPAPDQPPDILIVLVDTLRRDALAVFDPAGQPLQNIDTLAANSFRFDDARSAASWTLPSIGALMTGSYPDRSGATGIGAGLSSEAVTLAELLREAGYETLGFTDGGMAGPNFFARGFDYMDGHVFSPAAPHGTQGLPRNGRPASPGYATFDRATKYLQQAGEEGAPRFLFVHSYAVHDYWKVQPWNTDRLEPFPDPLHYEDCVLGRQPCPPEQWERMKALYAAAVRRIDQAVGRLLLALESTQRGKRSIVIFLSDHGEGFDPAAGRIHHGGRLHEDQLRVPLLLRVPGMTGRDIATPVSLVDLAPTLLELAGLPLSADFDGRSLLPQMRHESVSEAAAPRALYAMEYFFWWDRGRRTAFLQIPPDPVILAVMEGSDWLIEDSEGAALYDMESDPQQRAKRTIGSQRAVERIEELRRAGEARKSRQRVGEQMQLSEETLQNLRSLGYVD